MADTESICCHSGNQTYRMLINICYFVLDGMLQTIQQGKHRMQEFSDAHMERLFRCPNSRIEVRYTGIIREGCLQNASTRPKWAKKDELALLNRMEKYSENHLLFLHRFDVPFDNNMSERDLRK